MQTTALDITLDRVYLIARSTVGDPLVDGLAMTIRDAGPKPWDLDLADFAWGYPGKDDPWRLTETNGGWVGVDLTLFSAEVAEKASPKPVSHAHLAPGGTLSATLPIKGQEPGSVIVVRFEDAKNPTGSALVLWRVITVPS